MLSLTTAPLSFAGSIAPIATRAAAPVMETVEDLKEVRNDPRVQPETNTRFLRIGPLHPLC